MSKSYKFGPFRLDTAKKRLFRNGEIVRLRSREFDILRFLIENPEDPVSAKELLEKFWPDEDVELNNVTQNISALRKALGDSPQDNKYIKTIGSSYRFVADREVVEAHNEDEDSNGKTPAPVEEEKPETAQQAAESGSADGKSPAQAADRETNTARSADAKAEASNERSITFHEWRRGPGKIITWIAIGGVILAIVFSVVGIIYNRAKLFASIPQFFLLLGAFGYILPGPKGFRPIEKDIDGDNRLHEDIRKATGYDNLDEWCEAREIAKKALGLYTIYWRGIVATWALLYFCLVFISDPTSQTVSVILFNNCNTAMLILCYNIMNQPIEIKAGKRDISDTSWVLGGITFVVTFLTIKILLLFYVPYGNKEITLYVFSLVSGIAGGVAMALYVGRLQSKFLGPSSKLVIALYSYTAIQSLLVFLVDVPKEKLIFDEATVPIIAVMLIDIALALKCLLYLYVAWLFQSGRLLFYLVRVRRTYKEVETEVQYFGKVLEEES